MLAFETSEMNRLGFGKARLRQVSLRHIQSKSLTTADAAIFLTRYAANVIQAISGPVRREAIIPHGVGKIFKRQQTVKYYNTDITRPLRCLYVSPIWVFKHQWVVIRAIELLRRKGYNLILTLVGGGDKAGIKLLHEQIAISDPDAKFVRWTGPVPQNHLPSLMQESDIFIFASSCENLPNSLLEAMAYGLPIACSNRGPMPEILEDGGLYFDPEDANTIASTISTLIDDFELRQKISKRALELSDKYSWKYTAERTFGYIGEVFNSSGQRQVKS